MGEAPRDAELLELLVQLSLTLRLRGVDLESATGLSGRELDLVALLKKSGATSVKGVARYYYDSEFEDASRRWMLAGDLGLNYRGFSDASLGNSNSRDDVELRIGLSNTAYFQDGWALVTKASYFVRDSNYPQFDLDNFTLSIGAELRF